MADIFLSYDHDDQARVMPLVAALEGSGWNVWWDHRILPGQTWDLVIKDALEKARCVVVVWTRHSVQSDWVRIEANNGHERRILVPVMLEAVTLPLAFQLVQTAALLDWNGTRDDSNYQRLAAGIRAVLGDGVAAAPQPAQPSEPGEPRALDAAIGRQLTLGEPANLIAMIRRSDSRGLKAILESDTSGVSSEDVVTRPFDLAFPVDAAGRRVPAQLTINVNAPDFDPPSQQKKVRVSPGRDSSVFDFLLTPRKAGALAVHVEAYDGDVCMVSRVLRPSAVSGMKVAGRLVVSTPLKAMVATAAAGSRVGVWRPPPPGEFTQMFGGPILAPAKAPPSPSAPLGDDTPTLQNIPAVGARPGSVPSQPPVTAHKAVPSRAAIGAGLAAAVLLLCAPVAWYVSTSKTGDGQATFPSKGSVDTEITVRPAGAEVALGESRCVAPCTLSLVPGKYELKVSAEGQATLTESVTIPSQAAVTITIDLDTGKVTVQ